MLGSRNCFQSPNHTLASVLELRISARTPMRKSFPSVYTYPSVCIYPSVYPSVYTLQYTIQYTYTFTIPFSIHIHLLRCLELLSLISCAMLPTLVVSPRREYGCFSTSFLATSFRNNVETSERMKKEATCCGRLSVRCTAGRAGVHGSHVSTAMELMFATLVWKG